MDTSEKLHNEQVKLGGLTYRLYNEGVLTEAHVREFEEIENEIRITIVSEIEELERAYVNECATTVYWQDTAVQLKTSLDLIKAIRK